MAKGVTELDNESTVVLVTNFRQEVQNLTKGTPVGHNEEVRDPASSTAISEEFSLTQRRSPPRSLLDVNPALSAPNRMKLVLLIAKFKDCFAMSSKVRQTAVVKHSIVTDDDAHPVHQTPYLDAIKKREMSS